MGVADGADTCYFDTRRRTAAATLSSLSFFSFIQPHHHRHHHHHHQLLVFFLSFELAATLAHARVHRALVHSWHGKVVAVEGDVVNGGLHPPLVSVASKA